MITVISYTICTPDGKPLSGVKNCRGKVFPGLSAYRKWEGDLLAEAEQMNGRRVTIIKTLEFTDTNPRTL